MASSLIAFPDHDEDPKKKGKDWILQAAKAIWGNWNQGIRDNSIFAAKAGRYAEIRDYAMGRQSVAKHQKELLPEEDIDESWTKISWEPRADGVVLRNIAVAKLQKAGFNILATAINPGAKDAQDDEYAKAKIKIMLREAMQAQAPQLAQHPMFKRLPGEAEDLESLQMEIDNSPKFNRAKDIEEAVQLVLYENEADKVLDRVSEDLVDFGVAVVKEGLDENNKVVYEHCQVDQFGCSFTQKPDFSDITSAFMVRQVKLSDLRKYFEEDDIELIRGRISGKNGNPTSFGLNTVFNNGYDIFKAQVLDFEFISYNKRVTVEDKDRNGNLKISKTKPSDATAGTDAVEGRYTSRIIEVVYRGKWVIDTDYIYDFGLAENMSRSANPATMARTNLSYIPMAANFNNMHAVGLTESMIPIIDDLNSAVFKLRVFRNELIPNGFDIDIAALENVALGGGGTKMTPMQLLDFFAQKGILLSRRSGISMDQNVNYKAVNAIQNVQAENLASLYNDIQASKQALRDITGLNELTDGSTPNARMLTTTANLANESTNNALWFLIKARKNLLEASAKRIVKRLQVAIKRGPYDGFDKQQGRWVSVPKSIQDFDYDIMLEDKPSDDQKQVLYELFKQDIAQGLLDTSDVITITNTQNIKQAQTILAYKVKRNKEKMQQSQMQNIQATTQAQQQSAAQAEMMKDQMAEKQLMRELIVLNATKSWEYEIAMVKAGQANQAVETKAMTEIVKSMGGDAAALPQPPMQSEAPQDQQMGQGQPQGPEEQQPQEQPPQQEEQEPPMPGE